MEENNDFPVLKESEAEPKLHILGVDDDKIMRKISEKAFKMFDVDYTPVENAQRGLEILNEDLDRFNSIISDRDMPGMDGASFLAKARELNPQLVTALATGRDYTDEELSELRQNGVDFYIKKPYSFDELNSLVESMKEKLKDKVNPNIS